MVENNDHEEKALPIVRRSWLSTPCRWNDNKSKVDGNVKSDKEGKKRERNRFGRKSLTMCLIGVKCSFLNVGV
jgi:hypothetical protein